MDSPSRIRLIRPVFFVLTVLRNDHSHYLTGRSFRGSRTEHPFGGGIPRGDVLLRSLPTIASSLDPTIAANWLALLLICCCAAMSRALCETPITVPSVLRMGDAVIDTETSVPSFRRRTVSK